MKKIALLLGTLLVLFAAVIPAAASSFGSGVAVLASETELIKSGLVGEKMKFCDTDFKQALGVADLSSVTIATLPKSAEGTLTLAGRRVGAGQSISRKNLAALSFTPTTRSVTEATFTFTVPDCCDGKEITCRMKFLEKVNYAPAVTEGAAKSAAWTQSGVASYGQIDAVDPEGDEVLRIVVRYPSHGTLTLSDAKTGAFRYLPAADYEGKDSFVYVLRDAYGNYSEPQKMTFDVRERTCQTVYADMTDHPAYNAALVMTAEGVMSGKSLGDLTFFSPDEEVTRAEFVTMLLKSAGVRADTTLRSSFFDDNADIPASLVSYVATAQKIGVINGSFENGRLLFRPNDVITRAEAAIAVANLLGVREGEVTEEVMSVAPSVPSWAAAEVGAMYALGIFDDTFDPAALTAPMTRADTASVLLRTSEVS